VIEEQLYCANHPKQDTVLRCGKCDKPICPRCVVQTPVGMRCRECANFRRAPIYDVRPARLAAAAAAGILTAVFGGSIFFMVVGPFMIWLSPVFGYAIGEVVSLAANRKRGPSLQLVAFVSIVLGAILGKYGPFLLAAVFGPSSIALAWSIVAQNLGRDIWLMLFTAIALVVGLSRVR
jgi:hypothetical protein